MGTIRPAILNNCNYFKLDMIKNNDTLNLFSDASMEKKKNSYTLNSCYGSIAVNNDTIIDEYYEKIGDTSVPAAELRGLRCSAILALKYRYNFRVINFFTDSQNAVLALRDNIMNWRWSEKKQYYVYNDTKYNREIKNQGLIFEIAMMLEELEKTNIVNIMHQRGHIERHTQMGEAEECFRRLNNFHHNVDPDVIRYISKYNSYVDYSTRVSLNNAGRYQDIVSFKPNPNLFIS